MSLDNINIKAYESEVAKRDEKLSSNSIRFRLQSLEKVRDYARRQLKSAFSEAITKGASDDEIRSKVIDYAEYLAQLENTIDVLQNDNGPVELVSSRAIRLVDKMIKAARANSKGVYSIINKENPSNEIEKTESTPISVQEIVEDNKESIADSVDNAISTEEELHSSIDDVFKEALRALDDKKDDATVEEPIVEASASNISDKSDVIDREEIERKINEKLESYMASDEDSKKDVFEYDYVPMTDDEIVAAREKILADEFSKNVKEENAPVRDEVEVAPERVVVSQEKEIPEFTVEPSEPVVVFQEPSAEAVVETPVARGVVASSDFMEKLRGRSFDELKEIFDSESKLSAELTEEANIARTDKEAGRKLNAEVIEEEVNTEKTAAETAEEEAVAEKKREELKNENAREAQELQDRMIASIIAQRKKNEELRSTIQSDKEELASINKDTEERRVNISSKKESIAATRENISSIARDSEAIQEETSKYKEMKMMFADIEEESISTEDKEMTR